MERIVLCGSEIREKRKSLLLLWQKNPLFPRSLFLFLICNHFLTDVRVACFFISSPCLNQLMAGLHSVSLEPRPCTWAHNANRAHRAWCWPARPDGTIQPWVHPSWLPCAWGLFACSCHFLCQHDKDQSARMIQKWEPKTLPQQRLLSGQCLPSHFPQRHGRERVNYV